MVVCATWTDGRKWRGGGCGSRFNCFAFDVMGNTLLEDRGEDVDFV